jgi:hypothetical protein
LQIDVAPTQRVAFVAEHWPQAPVGSQAGRVPPQSVSLEHATQVWVTSSQTGAVPPHWAADVQPTQSAAVASQTGRLVPAHSVRLLAEHWPHAPLGSHAGAAAGHSASRAQARQVCVPPQTGVAPPHCELDVHATHVPVATLHAGVAPAHSVRLLAEHWPHTPLGWHAGVAPPHGASLVQPRQVCEPGSQTGAAAPQSALLRHATQKPLFVSHSGVAPVQRVVFVAEHCVHAPVAKQAGVAPPHSASPAQARHVVVASSQTGRVPPQVAFVVHGTQVPLPMLQAGVALEHCDVLLAEHWPHAPLTSQAGVTPPHSTSPPQARQVFVAASQTGVASPHCAFDVQGTHTPTTTWQTGVAPPQRVAFAAEHWPQAPPGWQAGVMPPHSLSPAQARHARNAGSQMGVAPEQSASARQPTQVPFVVWQTGVAPVHWLTLPSEHWPQAPVVWHAGVAPPQSTSPAHARQTWIVVLQTGTVPPQCALDVHGTQTPPPTSQAGVAPAHCVALLAEHWPQAPVVWQAGAEPPHSPSPPHARHECEVPSHTGVVPAHSAFDVQVTQVPLGV